MRKSFVISNVRTIFNIAKPIVVFEVVGGEAIVRNPKQALIDLQNSGRALNVNQLEFANGIEGVSQDTRAKFISALLDTVGATLSGDITPVRKGDTYEANEYSSVITDKNHALYGKVKVGDTVTVAEDGSPRVEGFLSILLTESEKMRREVSGTIAQAMLAMYGFGQAVPQASAPTTYGNPLEEEAPAVPTATEDEAFGTRKAVK
jgi:hypothetical protein